MDEGGYQKISLVPSPLPDTNQTNVSSGKKGICARYIKSYYTHKIRPIFSQHGAVKNSNPHSCSIYTFDACHEKTDRKEFVIVIPKEGLEGVGIIHNIIHEGSRVIFYSQCHTQRRIGGAQGP